MPGVHKRKDYFTSLTGNYYSSDTTEDKKYCVKCESFGFPYKELKARVYQDHELINGQIPSDSENWIMCYTCGTIYPVEHGKQESEITGFKEIPDTIHDSKRLVVEPFVTPRSRTNKINRKVRNDPQELDTDIQQRLDNGSQLVSYSDNSPNLQ